MLDDLLGDLLGGLFGARAGERLVGRRAKKLGQSGKTECGLRVMSGHHAGLSEKWCHGTAQLGPGSIRLDGLTVRVVSIDRTSARRPAGRETWSVSAGTEIVRVQTDGAVLEWAVLKERLDWAVEQVQQPAA